ncbi:UDP-N-acetylmuramoyl-L-alanyl-D-glutamate--2,6-diaminopimelate ligase [Candidatus Hydrogenedentota bacterium]
MKLGELVNKCLPKSREMPFADLEITGITSDSRQVKPGSVFVAIKGTALDGHEFIESAITAGATVVVGSERASSEMKDRVPYIIVGNPRRFLALGAQLLAGNPTENLKVVGITGTNGKSSTLELCRAIIENSGGKCATVGTLGYNSGMSHGASTQTTPDATQLAAIFKEARDSGVEYIVMEVSSHALHQFRVDGIDFNVGVFTNLTQDHLDYHAGLQEYTECKKRFFDSMNHDPSGRAVVVNMDDPAGEEMTSAFSGKIMSYALNKEAQLTATNISHGRNSTRFVVEYDGNSADFETPLAGIHNVYNCLAATGACLALGFDLSDCAHGISALDVIAGRFERIVAGQAFDVIVDYAHTEDGLRNVLKAGRDLGPNRIIAVFGCGGDRDRSKRPKMAAVVAELSDLAVLTSDNPRTEAPERIILDAEVGFQKSGGVSGETYWTILDRREAIGHALCLAREGDIVIIAGKGHETYQIVGSERHDFDDRIVAREILDEENLTSNKQN